MSGICAVFRFDGGRVGAARLEPMTRAASHRGVDSIDVKTRNGVGMACLRLDSTPESVGAANPVSDTEDRLWAVADARLDDRGLLIERLGLSGRPAGELSDAELILAAYRRWGRACPERLVGDFAFAIWDDLNQRAFCARDPLGVKPLHYARKGRTLLVASEARQILAYAGFETAIDRRAAADHLAFRCHDRARTMFEGVRRLEAGNSLSSDGGEARPARYWDGVPKKEITYERREEYVEHFLELFERGVRERARVTGNVGVLMSGGLDSCSVAAVAKRALEGAGRSVAAVSLTFEGYEEANERPYAEAMSQELGLDVDFVDCANNPLLDRPTLAGLALESPYLGWESGLDAAMASARDRGCKVLLTGQGGDALLMGTAAVYAEALRRGDLRVLRDMAAHAARHGRSVWAVVYALGLKPLVPASLRRVARSFRRPRPDRNELAPWLRADFVRSCGLREAPGEAPAPRFRQRSRQRVYEGLLHDGYLDRVVYWHDRRAHEYGLEMRHPFLDRRLVEFVLAIPPRLLFEAGRRKVVLKEAMRGVVPEKVRARRRKSSLADYFETNLRRDESVALVGDLFSSPMTGKLGWIDPTRFREAWEGYLAGRGRHLAPHLWSAVSMEAWLRAHSGTLNAFSNRPQGLMGAVGA